MAMTDKRPLNTAQSLTVILCGMALALFGLARLVFGDGSMDHFLGATMLMIGNWMALPQMILAAVSPDR